MHCLHVGNFKLSLVFQQTHLTAFVVDAYEVKVHRTVAPYTRTT